MKLAALAVVLAGCHATPAPRPSWPDAPASLRDEADRETAVDAMWALPAGTPARIAARARIADATRARLAEALEAGDDGDAADLLEELAGLWSDEPGALGRELAPAAPLLERVRAKFARSARLSAATLSIVLLAEVEPARRAAYLAELDEVLAYVDELATADAGAQAVRAQPIQLLGPLALALPLPWLVDRYVTLLEQRQRAIATAIAAHGASLEIVRAHPDLLRTARRIASALARAGRARELHAHLQTVPGLGSDRELSLRAEILADQKTASAYADLATALRFPDGNGPRHPGDGKEPDFQGALAIELAGLREYPGDAALLAAAAGDARALGRIDQPIALYEQALDGAGDVDGADALRLGKLMGERIGRACTGGRPAEAREAWRDTQRFLAHAAHAHPHAVWSQAAALAESALGRGLLGLGLVDEAEVALERSIERAPSVDSFEALATLELERDRLGAASRWAALGLESLGDATAGDRYRRAKLERLAGDIAHRAKQDARAREHATFAVQLFASLGTDRELPRALAAERALERGRARYVLAGQPAEQAAAIEDVVRAVELDPDTPATATTAVDFLVTTGNLAQALDAFHAALGGGASELHKTYMSLWVVGEARRRGATPDRLAIDYLTARRGDIWYELLAEAATGRLDPSALASHATTGPRRAELAFYTATLGLDRAAATPAGSRALLEQVVAARVVLEPEYRIARAYLAR